MYFPNLIKQAIMEAGKVDLLGALCISVKNNYYSAGYNLSNLRWDQVSLGPTSILNKLSAMGSSLFA